MSNLKERIDHNFKYHSPKPGQPMRYESIRDAFKALAHDLRVTCPESRELSVAMTKLEEACMWANASIARNE